MFVQQDYKMDADTVAGVCFDGRILWASLIRNGQGALARIDRKTGEVLGRVETAIIAGLTFDGTRLWGVTSEGIHAFDAESLAIIKTLPRPKYDGFLSGLAWDGESLWLGAYDQKLLLKLDPGTGAVLKEVSSDRYVTGITWVGEELWHATANDEDSGDLTELRRLDADSGAVLSKVETPFVISGLHHDGDVFCAATATSAACAP